MTRNYTARYTKIDSGYMGQLVEWPEVVTEGSNIEECRSMLRDALQEMTLAYQQLAKDMPASNDPRSWHFSGSPSARSAVRLQSWHSFC